MNVLFPIACQGAPCACHTHAPHQPPCPRSARAARRIRARSPAAPAVSSPPAEARRRQRAPRAPRAPRRAPARATTDAAAAAAAARRRSPRRQRRPHLSKESDRFTGARATSVRIAAPCHTIAERSPRNRRPATAPNRSNHTESQPSPNDPAGAVKLRSREDLLVGKGFAIGVEMGQCLGPGPMASPTSRGIDSIERTKRPKIGRSPPAAV